MKQIIKQLAVCFAALLWCCCVYAQPNITRVEYYIDSDPGYNNATALSITAGTNLVNLAININPSSVSQGVHILGVRAKDANGAWSQDNRWLFARPYSSDTTGPGTLPNITRVEYYLDSDPGYGNATTLTITAGTNLSNLAININPSSIAQGVHILGVRAKDANGAWSQDNRWLFARPFASDTTGPGPLPNITRAEYYLDTDPGYGNATAISIGSGNNLPNLSVNIDPATLTEGVHIFGVRTKDANGAWSQDNRWLFARPYASDTTGPGTAPDLKQVEYYIDTDPGYGKGVQVAQENVTNISNLSVSINISGYTAGTHTLYMRSRDGNSAWSLDNKWDFTVSTATNAASIIANSISKKIICAGENLSVGYDAKGTYNTGNIFTAQLSNATGSFTTPTVIGSLNSKALNGLIQCTVPASVTTGTGYKVRIVSSNNAVTGAASVSALAINAVPATPIITPSGATTFCAGGSVTLTSSSATNNVWSNGATTQNINVTTSGTYSVTVSNTSGCTATSTATTVTVNPKPAPTITASQIPTGLCPGKTDTLTSSAGSSYLWSTGATTQSITVNAAGSYTVTVTNTFGCSGTSAATVVTYSICPVPTGLKATVTSSATATLKWKVANCAAQYQLQYRPVTTSTWITVTVPALSYKAKNLLPATTYEWQVATVCQVSPQILSAYKPGTNFTTAASPGSAITNDGVKIAGDSFSVLAYPNPAANSATLQISGADGVISISISDAAGKVLWQSRQIMQAQIKLPVEKLAAGVYLVSVNNGKQIKVVKLIKE